MMEQTQIELDFENEMPSKEALSNGASNVVHLGHFLSARKAQLQGDARSKLVASIVESVDEVWDNLEAM